MFYYVLLVNGLPAFNGKGYLYDLRETAISEGVPKAIANANSGDLITITYNGLTCYATTVA